MNITHVVNFENEFCIECSTPHNHKFGVDFLVTDPTGRCVNLLCGDCYSNQMEVANLCQDDNCNHCREIMEENELNSEWL